MNSKLFSWLQTLTLGISYYILNAKVVNARKLFTFFGFIFSEEVL